MENEPSAKRRKSWEWMKVFKAEGIQTKKGIKVISVGKPQGKKGCGFLYRKRAENKKRGSHWNPGMASKWPQATEKTQRLLL